jgi:hypothetical protein
MYNVTVFNALGRVVNSKKEAQDASEPTSPTPTPAMYVASFIVYMIESY